MESTAIVPKIHSRSRRRRSIARWRRSWPLLSVLLVTLALPFVSAQIVVDLHLASFSEVHTENLLGHHQATVVASAETSTPIQPSSSSCGFYGAPYGPAGTVYDSVQDEIFVADSETNEVYVISAANQTLLRAISLGSVCVNPFGLAYDAELGEVFVAEAGNSAIGVISDVNDSVIASFPVNNGQPWNIVVDSGLNELFVADPVHGNITVLSLPTGTLVSTIQEGRIQQPSGLSYAASLGEVFVANNLGNYSSTISVVSDRSDSVVSYVPINCLGPAASGTFGEIPFGTAFDPLTGDVYVSCEGGNGLAVVATTNNTQVGYVPLDDETAAITYDANQDEIWAVAPFSGQVFAVSGSTNSVVGHGETGGFPFEGVAVDSRTGCVYVTNFKQTNVTVFNSNADPIASISLPTPPAPASLPLNVVDGLLVLVPVAALVTLVAVVAIVARPRHGPPSRPLDDTPSPVPENK